VIAPGRARRPGAWRAAPQAPTDPAACPFCEGHEAETPPETFALAPPGREPDTPGWQIRVVPNKFPAFGPWPDEGRREGLFEARQAAGRQEVVIHGPRHVASLADLGDAQLELVAQAWSRRAAAARAAGFPYVHALVNEGRDAGASLDHTHSQLVWLPESPPLVQAEEPAATACVLCEVIAAERAEGARLVAERDGLVLLAAYAARQPYELLVAPEACEPDPYTSASLGAALGLAAEGLRRIRSLEGPLAVNLWLHAGGHWHLELLPRVGVLAGIELGAGYFVCTLAPEEAAEALRPTG
jgi:UDPglucose--hexose-1-phosphate uridylyltransferase